MEAKEIHTSQDCAETGFACSIKGRVVVLSRQALPQNYPNQ